MSDEKSKMSRRSFLKAAGIAGFVAHTGGLVAAGKVSGKSSETYTGWESNNPDTQFFNREPFEFMGPAHLPVGKVRRPSHLTDLVFGRVAMFERAYKANPGWTPKDPIEKLGLLPPLVAFYREFPERLEWDFKTFNETVPTNMKDRKEYGNYYLLASAYESGFSATAQPLPRPNEPPEESDFQTMGMFGKQPLGKPTPFKSRDLAAEFIKEMAHKYGATIVGITKTNPEWLYSEGWRGCPPDYDFSEMPKHWEYAIVMAVPMEWDVILSSPQFSTSMDAYNRVSTAALRLEGCLKFLGYPARAHTPNTEYDLIVPPHAIEAGLGEVARTGFCVTPELGGNARMAVVTTNMPMKIDKPIDFGVARFCINVSYARNPAPLVLSQWLIVRMVW